jgi:hypothetical protein
MAIPSISKILHQYAGEIGIETARQRQVLFAGSKWRN